MPKPFLTSHVGEKPSDSNFCNYSTFVDGHNGFLYGIPAGRSARRVLKFDPKDQSHAAIGPDLGDGAFPFTWRCGVFCDYNRAIYCPPSASVRGHHTHFLKIHTADDTVEILTNVALPSSETSEELSWQSGALADDNRIYFMPCSSRRILKLDPATETLTSVGADLGEEGGKYKGTVMGLDGCLYGIPCEAERIIKFDPSNPDTLTVVGESIANADDNFGCGNGVLGNDGHIYALSEDGRILKINTTKTNYSWIEGFPSIPGEWGDPIVGIDSCVYWPPDGDDGFIKFDPGSQKSTIAGSGDYCQNDYNSYLGGALASRSDVDNNGVIYCIPYNCEHILAIDPFNELSMTLEKRLYEFPKELGRLFAKKKDDDCVKDDETFYENAARKFGTSTVLELLDKILPYDSSNTDSSLVAKYDEKNDPNISATTLKLQNKMRKDNDKHHPLFTIAASCENSHLDVIYHLLRRDVSSLCGYIGTAPGDDGQGPNNTTIINNGGKEKGLLNDCEQEKKRKFVDESG